jgi:hypothetical protein
MDNTSLRQKLAFYVADTVAPFYLKDIYNALDIYSICENEHCDKLRSNPKLRNRKLCPDKEICIAKDKGNIRRQLVSFQEKGLVEKSKRIGERYRRIDDQPVEIDIINATPDVTIDIKYPFGLDRVLRTMPKELVVLAGATGAGKSAYLLNFCLDNLAVHEVNLFTNTEMTAARIKKRLMDHPEIGGFKMSNLHAFQREDNFADVLKPDGINVIDYLEVSSERPASVGDELAAIHNKLKDGMALVAIQKKAHQKDFKGRIWEQELGVGGEWSKRKAGVYLTIDHYPENKLVIRKCRERTHDHINPVGMEFKFKLVKGIWFTSIEDPDDLMALKPVEPEVIEVNVNQEELPF